MKVVAKIWSRLSPEEKQVIFKYVIINVLYNCSFKSYNYEEEEDHNEWGKHEDHTEMKGEKLKPIN